MYFYIIKKNVGDNSKDILNSLLKNYYKRKLDDFFVSIPGYMSTQCNTINDFFNRFMIDGSHQNVKPKGYFFRGVNGDIKVKHISCNGSCMSKTIQEYINSLYGGYQCNLSQKKDHSKMLFFIEKDSFGISDDNNIDGFINGYVNAILIGSSNQSNHTYFNKNVEKGECDIFLIDSNVFKKEDIEGDEDKSDSEEAKDDEALRLYEEVIEDMGEETTEFFSLSKGLKNTQPLNSILKKVFIQDFNDNNEEK